MGLLVECPKCKRRSGLKVDICKCGFALKKQSSKAYWIEYRDSEKARRRERVGPSRKAAEMRLSEIRRALVEGRYIHRDKSAKLTFDDLSKWYLDLPEVKAKKSYRRDQLSV